MPHARPILPGPFGRLAAAVLRRAVDRRNARYDSGRGVVTFDRAVISVGNLSVGGTGKTPVVAWIVRALREAGLDPCVAMRGYRARGGESDEAGEYARAFQGLPIVARSDRVSGLIELFGSERGATVDSVVLDDGFQHRRIARQVDLVLLDATRTPTDDALIPAGWLREPVESLRRATHLVLTHAEMLGPADLDRIERTLRDRTGRGLDAIARHAWTALDGEEPRSLEWLTGRRVVAACAIGNPGPFLAELERRLGSGSLVGTLVLRDHDPFDDATVGRLSKLARTHAAQAIVVTEKDWSKLARVPAGAWPCPVLRPRLEVAFDSGSAALRSAILSAVERVRDEEPDAAPALP